MHSENYNKVLKFYKTGLWDLRKVRDAVGRWITADEYKEITGDKYPDNK